MSRTYPHIHDIVREIIENLRATGTISASVEASGVYTLTTDNELVKNVFIEIDGNQYQVLSATPTDFTIKAASGLDFTGLTWSALYPYYDHEKIAKAHEILSQMTGPQSKWKKYPYVLLIHPYSVVDNDFSYVTANNTSIIIVNPTQNEWNSDQRYTNNFNTILEPIYYGILNGLIEHPAIMVEGGIIPHTRTDNLFIDGNPLPDKLDGLLMELGALNIYTETNCELINN